MNDKNKTMPTKEKPKFTQTHLMKQCELFFRAAGNTKLADTFKNSRGFCFALTVAQRLAAEFDYELEWYEVLYQVLNWDGKNDSLSQRLSTGVQNRLPAGLKTLLQVFDYLVQILFRHQSFRDYQENDYMPEATGLQTRYFLHQESGGLTKDLAGNEIKVKAHCAVVETFSKPTLAATLSEGVEVTRFLQVRNMRHACGVRAREGDEGDLNWFFYNSSTDVLNWHAFSSQVELMGHMLDTLGADLVIESYELRPCGYHLRSNSPAMARFSRLAQESVFRCQGHAVLLLALYNEKGFCHLLRSGEAGVGKTVADALAMNISTDYAGYQMVLHSTNDGVGALTELAAQDSHVLNLVCNVHSVGKLNKKTYLHLLIEHRPYYAACLFEQALDYPDLARALQENLLSQNFSMGIVARAIELRRWDLLERIFFFIGLNEKIANAVAIKWGAHTGHTNSNLFHALRLYLPELDSKANRQDALGVLRALVYLLRRAFDFDFVMRLFSSDADFAERYFTELIEFDSEFKQRVVDFLLETRRSTLAIMRFVDLKDETFNAVLLKLKVAELVRIVELDIPYARDKFANFLFSTSLKLGESTLITLLKADFMLVMKLNQALSDADKLKLTTVMVKLIASEQLTRDALVRLPAGVDLNDLISSKALKKAGREKTVTRAELGVIVQANRAMTLLNKLFPSSVSIEVTQEVFLSRSLRRVLSDAFHILTKPRANQFFSSMPAEKSAQLRAQLCKLNNGEQTAEEFVAWFDATLARRRAPVRRLADESGTHQKRRRGLACL